MKNIAILTGGDSAEYDISILSANTVLQHLNPELFNSYINYYIAEVVRINKVINETENPIYLFGAHLFSQYLIAFGLDLKNVKGVLDNSKTKNGQRLYGTSYFAESPAILKNVDDPVVILKAGMYNDEIMNDILININPNTKFLL